MDSLPEDIFLEFFLLLPVKSLLRSKLVCKLWRSRISNPDFVKRHVAKTTNNPNNDDLFIAYDNFNHSFSVIDVNSLDRAIRLKRPVDDSFSYVVASCNGLLCLAGRASELYLWNPVTRQVKILHGHKYTVRADHFYDDSIAFGFGFDHATSDYKAVRIVQERDDIELVNRVEVYSLNENCWKEINLELEIGLINVDELAYGVATVNGSIYWLARKRPDDDSGLVVLSFNVQSLNFCTIQLPDDLSTLMLSDHGRKYHEVHVLQFKESVALCDSCAQGGFEIYTLHDGSCWTKILTVESFDYLGGCLKTGEIIGRIYRSDDRGFCFGDVVLYDSENDVVKYIQQISDWWRTLYRYIESLFDLN